MVNVVIYCRVSSDEQARKDLSIPAQRKALRRWVEDRGEHQIVREFVDEGQSAYGPAERRPGFSTMIRYCQKEKVDTILVHKLDRFSRNRDESVAFKALLRACGVQVCSITETFDPDTPQGFLFEGMIEVINQFYSMNLSTETLKGMRENAERGNHNGGTAPYGYRRERIEEGGKAYVKLVPGPAHEVELIREIFDMAVTGGKGARSIATLLNERGVPGPSSSHWGISTITFILNNRAYIGDQVWYRSKKRGRTGRQRTSEEDWIITPDAHPALISRELFERRKAAASKRAFTNRTSPELRVKYLLSRLIRCGNCGAFFHGYRQTVKLTYGDRKTYYRYYCGGYKAKGKSVCPSLPIRRDWVEGAVLGLIRDRLCSVEVLEELGQRIRKKIEEQRRKYAIDPRVLARQVADLNRQVDNYYRAIGSGMDPVICQGHIDELSAKREQVQQEAATLAASDYYERALERHLQSLRDFAADFEERFTTLPFEAQRRIVLKFIEGMEVVDRRELRIRLRVPADDDGLHELLGEEKRIERRDEGSGPHPVGSLHFLRGGIGGGA